MNVISVLLMVLLLTSCVRTSSIPLGNDLAEINISAHRIYGRAGAQQLALIKAAETTIALGYDKFIVKGNEGWNEQTMHAGNYGSVAGSGGSFSGSSGGFFETERSPEAKMIIQMFHDGEKGSKKAIDARQVIAMNKERASIKSPLE